MWNTHTNLAKYIPRSMLYVIKSPTCCCKNLLPLLLMFFWPDVCGKPIISKFSAWSWKKWGHQCYYNVIKSLEMYLYQFHRLIYIKTSNLPNIPTSGSDMVIISGSTHEEGRTEMGFWPLPIASCNLSRRL